MRRLEFKSAFSSSLFVRNSSTQENNFFFAVANKKRWALFFNVADGGYQSIRAIHVQLGMRQFVHAANGQQQLHTGHWHSQLNPIECSLCTARELHSHSVPIIIEAREFYSLVLYTVSFFVRSSTWQQQQCFFTEENKKRLVHIVYVRSPAPCSTVIKRRCANEDNNNGQTFRRITINISFRIPFDSNV